LIKTSYSDALLQTRQQSQLQDRADSRRILTTSTRPSISDVDCQPQQ